MRRRWEALASCLGILGSIEMTLGKVFFLGSLQTNACAEHMRQADVFVLPSLLECCGAGSHGHRLACDRLRLGRSC